MVHSLRLPKKNLKPNPWYKESANQNIIEHFFFLMGGLEFELRALKSRCSTA
jgi:hypothetical protein